MNDSAKAQPTSASQASPWSNPESGAQAELAGYLPHLNRMSKQLQQTSKQIEDSVVGVCDDFQGIAERAKTTVGRATEFLSGEAGRSSGKRSFEGLIENTSRTLLQILKTTEEAGAISCRAIERIEQMEKASEKIAIAMTKLEQIARENKMLSMNAQIEAAHAGDLGAGFAVVAVEVVSQTERAQEVTRQVSELIVNLQELAGSTTTDLRQMNDRDHKRLEGCRVEVDESLGQMQATHDNMRRMLTGMNEEGLLLENEIRSAVRGLQFQDRVSQQMAHVVQDLDTLHNKLAEQAGPLDTGEIAAAAGFSSYTMYEERLIAGMADAESAAGDVELF
ncbi:MAG: methyl-accepting chemotaxis protein [Acidobacteriaceae bacterium]